MGLTTNSYYILMCAVEALHEIAEQVGKKDWDFSLNPCDGNANWSTPKRKEMPLYNNTLTCNCSYPNGQCHVVQMYATFPDLYICLSTYLKFNSHHYDFCKYIQWCHVSNYLYIILFLWGGGGGGGGGGVGMGMVCYENIPKIVLNQA